MSALGEQLIGIVRAKADAQPDFVYEKPLVKMYGESSPEPGCVYVHDGRPSCLLGRAMWDAGLIDASLERSEDNYGAFVRTDRFGQRLIDELTPEEWFWLGLVQSGQDSSRPWGVAVRDADDTTKASL